MKTVKQKKSIILQIGIFVVAIGLIVSLIQLQIDIGRKNEVFTQLKTEAADQKYEQKRLERLLEVIDKQLTQQESVVGLRDGSEESEYIRRIAREKLGFVMPDEIVFYDVAGN